MSSRKLTTVSYEAADIITSTATVTPDERYRELYHVTQFITGLILYPIFCCFGLTCNCLTLVVLRSRKVGGVMSAFLAALAVNKRTYRPIANYNTQKRSIPSARKEMSLANA